MCVNKSGLKRDSNSSEREKIRFSVCVCVCVCLMCTAFLSATLLLIRFVRLYTLTFLMTWWVPPVTHNTHTQKQINKFLFFTSLRHKQVRERKRMRVRTNDYVCMHEYRTLTRPWGVFLYSITVLIPLSSGSASRSSSLLHKKSSLQSNIHQKMIILLFEIQKYRRQILHRPISVLFPHFECEALTLHQISHFHLILFL
jgi:hypothetical protein